MKHRLLLYAPCNPERHNPATWYRTVNGREVWAGPTSGSTWQRLYAHLPGKKPAPAYNDCIFLKRSVHQDVCAAKIYDPCKRCRLPRMYTGVKIALPASVKKRLMTLFKK